MNWDFSEYQKLIGTQLKGKVIEEKIGQEPKIKTFRKYILSNGSIVLLRMRLGSIPIRIVLPHTYFTGETYMNRLNVIVNEDFVITNLQIG